MGSDHVMQCDIMLQTELDRFHDTILLMKDYYIGKRLTCMTMMIYYYFLGNR